MYAEREAEGVRLQRHRVPHLHPDGVAAARERPLLHARLPARGLHAGRASTGSRTTRCARLLLRHFPELEPALEGVANPFAPWNRVARRGAMTRARARHSQSRPRQGRPRARVPDRQRRRADARRHAVRERRAAPARGDLDQLGKRPTDLKRIAITHGHRSHLGGLAALERASGATAVRPRVGGGHRLRRPPRAAGQPLPRQSLRLFPFQLGLWLGRPKHVPCRSTSCSRTATRSGRCEVLYAPGHSPGPPRVPLAGAPVPDRRRRASRRGPSSVPAGRRST